MEVDLGRHLRFLGEICSTLLWPGMLLWGTAAKAVFLVELMMLWEEGI